MSKSCRLCLEQCSEFLEIFSGQGLLKNIPGIISKHFWFQPLENDNYSQLICMKCWDSLEGFHQFYQTIEVAQNRLFEAFGQPIEITPDVVFKDEPLADLSDDLKNESNRYSDSNESDDGNIKNVEKQLVKVKEEENKSDDSDAETKPKGKCLRKKRANNIKEDTKNSTKLKPRRRQKSKSILNNNDQEKQEINKRIVEFYKLDCEICQMKFWKFSELRIHYEQIHLWPRGYVTCCNKKLRNQSSLLEHLDWHFDPNKFRCSICNKIFKGKTYLQFHMATHAPPSNTFCCDMCGKEYVTKPRLAHHLRTAHIPDRDKHECQQCGKKFPIESILKAHIRRVHELCDKAVCYICAKVFQNRTQWKIHLRNLHPEEKIPKVQCTICGTWLKHKMILKDHMRQLHFGSTETCKICGKVSPNKKALLRHIDYVHKMKPIHKCNLCDKSFKELVALKEHEATHTGATLYTCPYCPKTSNSKANMSAHRKHKHTADWLRDRNSKLESTARE